MAVYLEIVIVGWPNVSLIALRLLRGYCENLHIVLCSKFEMTNKLRSSLGIRNVICSIVRNSFKENKFHQSQYSLMSNIFDPNAQSKSRNFVSMCSVDEKCHINASHEPRKNSIIQNIFRLIGIKCYIRSMTTSSKSSKEAQALICVDGGQKRDTKKLLKEEKSSENVVRCADKAKVDSKESAVDDFRRTQKTEWNTNRVKSSQKLTLRLVSSISMTKLRTY